MPAVPAVAVRAAGGDARPGDRAGAEQVLPNGQVPVDPAAVRAGAMQALTSSAAGAGSVEPGPSDTASEIPADDAAEDAATAAAAPALPAFLALLGLTPQQAAGPAGSAGSSRAAGSIGAVPEAEAQASRQAAATGQVPGQALAALPPGQFPGATPLQAQGAGTEAAVDGAGAGAKAGAEDGAKETAKEAAKETAKTLDGAGVPVHGGAEGARESAVPTEAARIEAGAKPDLLAALATAAPEQPAAQAAQALGQAGPAHAASHAAVGAAVPAAPPVQIGQVPMTIGLRALSGSSQFEIRLDPLDLGRIDVKLEIDKERGTVMTHMVVERVETLAMLQRDAGSLQQALSQAGLDAQEGGINLSLRGDGQSEGRAGEQGGGQEGRAQRSVWTPEAERAAEAPLRMLHGLGGLDIRI